MVRTDQLAERLKISVKLTAVKFRWQTIRLIQLVGLGMLSTGAFLFFRREVDDLQGIGPPLSELPVSYLIQDYWGNILLFFIGIVVVALANRL